METNHILLVEDDKEIREGVEIYLKSQGYEVFQAADGIEGLKILDQEEIHLAIVDVMMPRMDGITMTVKLREKYDFPVIILSAKTEEVDKIMGLNIGADSDGAACKSQFPAETVQKVSGYAGGKGTEGKEQHLYHRRTGAERGYRGSHGGRKAGEADADRI